MKNQWLDVDKEGHKNSLGQKDKFFLVTETISNAWDADDVTKVELTLTRPDENGHCWLRVTDDSPAGWTRISDSHTLFAESTKKDKSNKRGRFGLGEKDVLALAIEASLTTVSGQILFNEDGTRTEGTVTRMAGSEFAGRFGLTTPEYEHIVNQTKLLLPPEGVTTLFNGVEIPHRKSVSSFKVTLPTVIAEKGEPLKNRERMTDVLLYDVLPGETAMIFEMGIPVVELMCGDPWHINVAQKTPVFRDRENLSPAYLRRVRAAVLTAKFADVKGDAAAAEWAKQGFVGASDEAVEHITAEQFGENYVTPSTVDVGSIKEAVCQDFNVIPKNALSTEQMRRLRSIKDADGKQKLQSTHDVTPTDSDLDFFNKIGPNGGRKR